MSERFWLTVWTSAVSTSLSLFYSIYTGRYGVLLVQFTVTAAFCARLMKASFDMIIAIMNSGRIVQVGTLEAIM